MATAAYPVPAFPGLQPQRARARIYADGSAVVQCGTQEFGTGAADRHDPGRGRRPRRRARAGAVRVPATPICRTRPRPSAPPDRACQATVHAAATALRDQLVALAIADDESPLHGAEPSAVIVQGADDAAGPASQRDLRRAAPAPTGWETRRRWEAGTRTQFGHRLRAHDLRGPVRGGRRRCRSRARPGPAHGRGLRARPRTQSPDHAQPAHGRHALGVEPGAARGHAHGRSDRPLGQREPGRVPGPGQRRRARRRGGAHRGTGRRRQSAGREGRRRDRAGGGGRGDRERGVPRHRPPGARSCRFGSSICYEGSRRLARVRCSGSGSGPLTPGTAVTAAFARRRSVSYGGN